MPAATAAPEKDEREIVAGIARSNAETKRALAQAREHTALAKVAEFEGRSHRIVADSNERAELIALASDSYHHVYRFVTDVTDTTAAKCMSTLQTWSRLEPGCDMEIVFSSPGGSIIAGMALFDFLQGLRSEGHHLTTGVSGMAASMAGILLMAGDHRWVGEQSWVMIHRAAFGASGKTFDVEDEVEWVNRIEKRIVEIFTRRSGLTAKKIRANWNRKDWWIEAEEALELNLVDEIRSQLL